MEPCYQSPSDELGYLIYCPTQEDLEDDFIEDLEDGFIWGGRNDVIDDDKSRVKIEPQSLCQDGNANVTRGIIPTIGADGQCDVKEEKVTSLKVQTNHPIQVEFEHGVSQRKTLKTEHCSLPDHYDPSLGGDCDTETASMDSPNSQIKILETDHVPLETSSHHEPVLVGDCNAERASMNLSTSQRQALETGHLSNDQSMSHHGSGFRGDDNTESAPLGPSDSYQNHEEIKNLEAAGIGRGEICERTELFKNNCYCNACNPRTAENDTQEHRDAEKRLKCSFCDKRFKYNVHLTRHLRTHTGEKPYNCSICGKAFGQKSSVDSHMKSHVDGYRYYCMICNRGYRQKSGLEVHMRTHTGEKPFECHVCKKKFNAPRTLARHKFIHTGERPHKCTVCNKGFIQRPALLLHMRTHSGRSEEKLFECTVCKGRYRSKVTLKQHMRTHTGEKPFECSVCSKRFTHDGAYYRHKKTHTDEKPYQCSMCSQRFTQSCSRARHMKTAHKGEK